MPINCESGNFNRFPKSTFDVEYEALNGNGHSQWERCISGVHLGSLGTIILRRAAKAGLLPTCADRLAEREFSHVELNAFCDGSQPTLFPCSKEDAATIRQLLLPLYERAALFAAINIAATGICSAQARGRQEGTIYVNADGSTFWKTSAIPFAERVSAHLATLLAPYHYTCKLVRIDEAPLLGAALAALN
jgi:hexokinase